MAHEHYELYTSPVVEREAAKGDADAAARRLAAIKTVQSISMCDEMVGCRYPEICTPFEMLGGTP